LQARVRTDPHERVTGRRKQLHRPQDRASPPRVHAKELPARQYATAGSWRRRPAVRCCVPCRGKTGFVISWSVLVSAQTGSARLVVGTPVGARKQVPLGGAVRRKGVLQGDGEVGLPRLTTMGL
jgi:hypothetical protein